MGGQLASAAGVGKGAPAGRGRQLTDSEEDDDGADFGDGHGEGEDDGDGGGDIYASHGGDPRGLLSRGSGSRAAPPPAATSAPIAGRKRKSTAK